MLQNAEIGEVVEQNKRSDSIHERPTVILAQGVREESHPLPNAHTASRTRK